jgi:DNA-binding transcriptional regulator YhcF (GntR family)
MTPKAQSDNSKAPSVITEFWGDETMKHGWTAIPNALLMLQNDLDISPTDFCVLLNILMHQWPSDGKSTSYPAVNTIATRIGVTKRTVQRGILNLERKGVLTTQQTNRNNRITKGKNIFDTSELKEKLNELSPEIKRKDPNKESSKMTPHSCKSCGVTAISLSDINKVFGVRKTIAGNIINSYCLNCRKNNN